MAKNNGSGKTIYKIRDITGKIIEIDTSKMMIKKRDKRKLHKKGGRVKK